MAPVVVAHGSSIYCSWLQWWLSYLSFVAPQWLQYDLLPVASVSVVLSCGSSLQYLSVACGSSISCRSCLQWYCLSFMAPLAVVRGSRGSGSIYSICRSWLQYRPSCSVAPVLSILFCGSSMVISLSWLRYLLLSFAAPVSPVVSSCGSCGSSSGSSTIYCHFLWLQAVACRSCGCRRCLSCSSFNRQPSSVLVIFL